MSTMRAVARLRNYPTSPFKMRLLADLVRNKSVDRSLVILENSPRHGARPLYRLLLSALSNWKQKNPGADEQRVVVTRITVDGGRAMRRVLPAPQGNAHWIKKRSHHIFVEVGVPDGLNSSKEQHTSLPKNQNSGESTSQEQSVPVHNPDTSQAQNAL